VRKNLSKLCTIRDFIWLLAWGEYFRSMDSRSYLTYRKICVMP